MRFDLGLLTISGMVGKLILRHIVRVILLFRMGSRNRCDRQREPGQNGYVNSYCILKTKPEY